MAAPDLAFVASNTFEVEWPRGSGRVREYPEVDRAEWVSLETAADRLVKGQLPLLDRLRTALAARPGDPEGASRPSEGLEESPPEP